MATTEYHTDTSHRLIRQAEYESSIGDSLQASEKAWGAAAHAVKSIAEREGWTHNSHGALFRAVRRISELAGDPEIRILFRVASGLHQNFYEGWLDDEDIAADIESVEILLGKLSRV